MYWCITLTVEVRLIWLEGNHAPFVHEQQFRFCLGGTWGPQSTHLGWVRHRDSRYPDYLPDYWHTEEYTLIEVLIGEHVPPPSPHILDTWSPPDGFSDDERWNGR